MKKIIIPVSYQFLQTLLTNGAAMKCIDGVPQSAVLIGVYIDQQKEQVLLKFTDESFDSVLEGSSIPFRYTTFETIR